MRKAVMSMAAALLVSMAVASAHADDSSTLEERRIEFLVAAVESLGDAQFIRNGTAYDAKKAADHLRSKRRKAGGRVKTAEDFIRYCASGSSVSGQPYEIRFNDGRVVTSAAFLQEKLREFSRPGSN